MYLTTVIAKEQKFQHYRILLLSQHSGSRDRLIQVRLQPQWFTSLHSLLLPSESYIVTICFKEIQTTQTLNNIENKNLHSDINVTIENQTAKKILNACLFLKCPCVCGHCKVMKRAIVDSDIVMHYCITFTENPKIHALISLFSKDQFS